MTKFFFLLTSVLLSLCSYSQNRMDEIAQRYTQKTLGSPSEQIYIQTNKGIYETGEDLWFKTYHLDSQTMGLTNKSKTLYLEMRKDNDSLVWQEKYPIENGISSGHVYINNKLPEGVYYLEGSTQKSFYRDTTGILSARKIRIVRNIAKDSLKPDKRKNNKRETFYFQTFPEGGNLIFGISSQLAFKATDSKNNPVEIDGALYEGDKLLTNLKSIHEGMGCVTFKPELGNVYHIQLKNGKEFSLPPILPSGINLHLIKQDTTNVVFGLQQSPNLPKQTVYLMGQMRGMLCCGAKAELQDSLILKIPVKNFFYQGIAEFTLYDASLHPRAERLVYVHPEKKLHIEIKPDKQCLMIRDKNTLKIKVTDSDGKPVIANLGISVYDWAYNNPTDGLNILNYCYLTSQIRGKICNPDYYFDDRNADRLNALDLLLQTQGWRRYVWQNETAKYNGKEFIKDEISGKEDLANKKKAKMMKGTQELVQVSGAIGNSTFIMTDSTGNFSVPTFVMENLRGGYVYLKPMLGKEFKPKLKLDNYFAMIDTVRKRKHRFYPIMDLSDKQRKDTINKPVVSLFNTMMLKEITIVKKLDKPFRDKFMGKLDSLAQKNMGVGWVCDDHGHPSNYLNDYIHGWTRHPDGYTGKRYAPVKGKTYKMIKYTRSKGYWVIANPMQDIKYIVYNGPEFSDEDLLKMNNITRVKGYYGKREFYQAKVTDMQSSLADARNTLYWNPSIVTDKNGEATISFYTSDINTQFIGVVEGLDGNGLVGTNQCQFRVIRLE